MKALSQDEILKVLKAVSDSPRDLAMILIAFRHGMRASEVCGLEVKDVDLKNGEITIRRIKGSLKTTQPLADLQGQRGGRVCVHARFPISLAAFGIQPPRHLGVGVRDEVQVQVQFTAVSASGH